jgi:hypothetical protein
MNFINIDCISSSFIKQTDILFLIIIMNNYCFLDKSDNLVYFKEIKKRWLENIIATNFNLTNNLLETIKEYERHLTMPRSIHFIENIIT